MLLSLLLPLSAAVIVVDPNGGGNATTIADGIAMAATGDTVEVVAGTYKGNIDFNGHSIKLVGRDGSASTFLVGDGNGPVVRVNSGEGAGTTLQGFTISGGNSNSYAETTNEGGGLFVSSVPITLDDLVFTGNTAYYGGGAFLSTAEGAVVRNCNFNANAGTVGAGLYIYGNTVTLSNTIFQNNASTNATEKSYGGGGVFYSATVVADHISFLRNSAGTYGGHLYTSSGLFNCSDCSFEQGTADGGGGYFIYATTTTLRDTTFSYNTAISNGGGLEMTKKAIVSLERVVFDHNTASYGAGNLLADSTLTGANLVYSNNVAAGGGGGIYSDVGTFDLRNSLFQGNAATGANGGGIALAGGTGTVKASIFTLNNASSGGGIHVNDNSTAYLSNLTLTENGSTNSAGGVRVTTLGFLHITSSISAWSSAGSGISAATGSVADIQYGNLYGNATTPTSGGLADPTGTLGNLAVDPMFVNFAADGAYNDDLHLAVGSPMIDAGDPTLPDVDTTPNDIGAYGGPYGRSWDADLDAYAVDAGDCDDATATTHPGAAELCDGIDNNCDNFVDEGCEADTDTDTDSDTDSDTDTDTDSDSDTDTAIDSGTGDTDTGSHSLNGDTATKDGGGESCGCHAASASPAALLALLGLAGLRRRRR